MPLIPLDLVQVCYYISCSYKLRLCVYVYIGCKLQIYITPSRRRSCGAVDICDYFHTADRVSE